ncbi:MAG: GHKL domain-containing protein [Oscillospiraceae bacterium]|nr:GHKL domain-containing protein [Oscillospiraceae bacterium]
MDMNIFLPAAVNSLVLSIPSHLMAYYPFRDRLRVALWKILLPVCLIQLAQSLFYGYTILQGGNGQMAAYGFAPIYIAIYLLSVRDDRFKVLFLYLFVTDYTMILRGTAVFLEARFFYQPGIDFTSGTSTLLNLVLLAVSAPFMLRFFSNAREKVLSMDEPVFWRTAWMVPACMTVIVMIFTASFEIERVRSFYFLFARVLLLLSMFVVYSNLLDALDGIRSQAALKEQAVVQEQLLNLQQTQYEQLLQHSGEVTAARHDLRQHLEMMRAYLEQKDIDGALTYLDAYAKKLPADIHQTFSHNFALNAVCTNCAAQARQYNIDFDVRLSVPERLPISEPELCALLGNLLKNALEACRKIHQTAPFILVRGRWKKGHLVLVVDNSCEQEPKWDNNRLLSTKHDGYGIGTWVVQETAERYNGIAEFTYRDGVFSASVLLFA